MCLASQCVTTGPACDDGDDCTLDLCDLSGCLHPVAPNGTGCDDGDACTTGDRCTKEGCRATTTTICDDENPCTVDLCTGGGACANVWLPTLGSDCSARAPGGLRLARAAATELGTTVKVYWSTPPLPGVLGFDLERAPTAAGPWAIEASLASDELAFGDLPLPEGPSWLRVRARFQSGGDGVSEVLAVSSVASTRYDLGPQCVSKLVLETKCPSCDTTQCPFPPNGFVPPACSNTAIRGEVRYPVTLATSGPRPLILLLHGNHASCKNGLCGHSSTGFTLTCATTPFENHLGLVWLAETLAAAGSVVVTVDADALNCRDTCIGGRGRLLHHHLKRWVEWATSTAAPFDGLFTGHVDVGRIGLVGHSRGGEAVTLVPRMLQEEPIVGVSVGAQGFRWIEDGSVRHVPAPRIEAVDTLGAGDTFHGAFTLALAEGMDVERAARFSCAAAAIKCTRFGGVDGSPTRDEVERFLATA